MQFALDSDRPNLVQDGVVTAGNNATEFLDLVSAAMPDGDVYLFGGYRLMVGDWPIDIWNARRSSIEEAHYQALKKFSEIEIKDVHKRWEVAMEIVARQRGLWTHDLIAV